GGDGGQGTGDETAQPGPHGEVEETLHNNLTCKGSGGCRRLSGAEQGNGEEDTGEAGCGGGGEGDGGLLNLGGRDRRLVGEHSGGEHEYGGINKQGTVHGDDAIDQVVAAGGAFGLFGVADVASLHQGRMQVHVVRHDRGAEDGYGQIEAVAVDAGDKPGDQF